jgi:hypothetical protein
MRTLFVPSMEFLGKQLGVALLNSVVEVNPNNVIEWLKLLPHIAIALSSILSIFGIKPKLSRKKKVVNENRTSTN